MRHATIGVILACLWFPNSQGAEVLATDTTTLTVAGDLKAFAFGTKYYENPILPQDTMFQGALDFRLKLEGTQGEHFSFAVHHQATAVYSPGSSSSGTASLQNATVQYPEAVDLSWSALNEDEWKLAGRIDRLQVTYQIPNLDITIGRQAISFGKGYFFTPMDLITPFNPASVDNEYKPGIDAIRLGGYTGDAGHVTLVLAYTGDWFDSNVGLATHGGTTLGVWDVGLFASHFGEEWVLGADTAGSIGLLSIRGEATYTNPQVEDPFVRAMVGADLFLGSGLTIISEFYLQTLGAADPSGYLEVASLPRFARGEIWSMGKYYVAVSLGYEITPLVSASMFSVMNLSDASTMIGPGLSWSASENASVRLGAYTGLGARPDISATGIVLNSEFGLLPTTAFLNVAFYF